MIKKEIFILCLIIILAAFLRLSVLDRFPAGFTADEAAQGYTAYSILKTGKDEWGVRLPLTPRSFGDYKPALQTYLMIPSIAIFGLNEFAVRLPNAILGSLGVLGMYLLVKELFTNSVYPKGVPALLAGRHSAFARRSRGFGRQSRATLRVSLGLFSSFLLAVSPWHISLSRGAFEANLTTFLMPFGFWLFLKGLREPKYLSLAGFFFGLNLFSYHAARLFTPLFLGVLGIWERRRLRELREKRWWITISGLIFGIFLILAFWSTLTGGGTRAADIGIIPAGFKAPKIFIDNYLSYLSPEFFFTQGAGDATYGMIPGRGLLYLFELPCLIFALYWLAKKWDERFLPILAWILLAPIPAALSLGVGYHANRVAVMMPGIQILSAYGGLLLWEKVKKAREGKEGVKGVKEKTVLLSCCLAVLLSCCFFLKTYFLDAPKVNAPAMSYGWKEVMGYLDSMEENYEKIVVSRRFSEPQAFIAFYKKWEPADFQEESGDWLKYQEEGLKFVDQLGSYSLGKYDFRNLNWNEDKNLDRTLLIGKPEDFPADVLIKKMIIYPDGERAFYFVDPEKE